MSEPIDRVQAVLPERRWRFRRREDRDGARAPETEAEAEVVSAPGPEAPAAPGPDLRDRLSGFATFAAQVLGQPGQKRGLKGGPETLEKARAAYLEAEYSGPSDRRIPSGRITKTEA